MLSKIQQKIIGFLKQGITPDKLAFTAATGICLGIIPLLGSAILLCTAAAIIFRLNMPAIQAVNYAVYPLQLLLYIPFLKTGAALFSTEKFNYSLSQIVNMLSYNMWKTVCRFFWINMSALLLWLIVAFLIYVPVYLLCNNLFNRIALKISKEPSLQ
jgi:uncharacterized protein (DUF2062 family)